MSRVKERNHMSMKTKEEVLELLKSPILLVNTKATKLTLTNVPVK